jgi:small nuclear ribonucleoprotein (snRNP)-like protein
MAGQSPFCTFVRSVLGRNKMLEEFLEQIVVIDMRSAFVCLGTLTTFDDTHLELCNADLHDLRDTHTSRENYVAAAKGTGIKHNRKRLLIVRSEVVAIARLKDVVAE